MKHPSSVLKCLNDLDDNTASYEAFIQENEQFYVDKN